MKESDDKFEAKKKPTEVGWLTPVNKLVTC